jgi:hypothetical protein
MDSRENLYGNYIILLVFTDWTRSVTPHSFKKGTSAFFTLYINAYFGLQREQVVMLYRKIINA